MSVSGSEGWCSHTQLHGAWSWMPPPPGSPPGPFPRAIPSPLLPLRATLSKEAETKKGEEGDPWKVEKPVLPLPHRPARGDRMGQQGRWQTERHAGRGHTERNPKSRRPSEPESQGQRSKTGRETQKVLAPGWENCKRQKRLRDSARGKGHCQERG